MIFVQYLNAISRRERLYILLQKGLDGGLCWCLLDFGNALCWLHGIFSIKGLFIVPVKSVQKQRQLIIVLDSKSSFTGQMKAVISRSRQEMEILRFLSKFLTRHILNEHELCL